MKQRCFNPNNKDFYRYGGREVKVCQEWQNSFDSFRSWSLENGYEEDLTIERIDVDGNYEPGNCKWIPKAEQSRNRRNSIRASAFGETKVIREWGRDSRCVVAHGTLYNRIASGMDPELAITTPPKTGPYAGKEMKING